MLLVDREGKKHRIFAFEVDLITAPLKRVDIKPALESFPGVREDEIFRPIGPVDILIGIQSAAIHPTTIEVSGNLRLLKTIFGTGKLVNGNSDSIHSEPVFMDKESFALGQGTVYKCVIV